MDKKIKYKGKPIKPNRLDIRQRGNGSYFIRVWGNVPNRKAWINNDMSIGNRWVLKE